MAKVVWLACLASLVLAHALPEECGECDSATCPEPHVCPGGVVPDVCGCCNVCASGLGQRCDLGTDRPRYLPCGTYLTCAPREDIGSEESEGVCECQEEGEVCGSDGNTYASLCHLLEHTTEDTDLNLAERGPCKGVPKIKTVPEDAVRPEGSVMVLDCEAVGYPVPVVSWELNRPDGSSIKLPEDNSLIAVQVRGGPERYMVTGWVQIMRVTQETEGTYSCVATNSEGEARASARLVLKEDESENEL